MGKEVMGRVVLLLIFTIAYGLTACSDDETMVDPPVVGPTEKEDSTVLTTGPIDFGSFSDTYGHLASPQMVNSWRHYNVHDPAILDARDYAKDPGGFYYSYSTDVAFGNAIRPGLQIRRSLNLVEWEFVGWVFNSLPSGGSSYIRQNGGVPNNSLWAPYAIKVGDEYRLYYSLASNIGRLSCIGVAVSDDPRGPFQERGVVVRSKGDNSVHTNAIDPSVIIDEDGRHWMYYGSSWDGIYLMELDPATGMAKTEGDVGVRIAHRGFTDGRMNGNIEGPEIIYNDEFGMYYLFIAYDWLETKYNVRVGRSESPAGPFYDMNGTDMNEFNDNSPMILAPYQFKDHTGWQGVSHPGVFSKDNEYYIAHQGRPGVNPYYMVLHVRQIHWTDEGWPMTSPERYALEEETEVLEEELFGEWEEIEFGYRVVPGFAEEQIVPDMQVAKNLTIDEGGTINSNQSTSWEYTAPWLTIQKGGNTMKLYVERGRDWENEKPETILFTGFNSDGTTYWGKKIE